MLELKYLAELWQKYSPKTAVPVCEFAIDGRNFAFNSERRIMGVINLSPDSWYRESVCLTSEDAVRRGRVLQAQGAAIVDVGAESTLAHAARVDDAWQNRKLLPVVKALRQTGVLVSVETYQLAVTRACLEAGANVLNLTAAEGTNEFYGMVAEHEAA